MTYRPKVVKRGKRRTDWRIVVPLIGLAGLLLYAGLRFLLPADDPETPSFTVCNKSLSETQALFAQMSYPDAIESTDYLIYGETLNLYRNPYVIGSVDPFIGKTVILRNVCDGYEWVYMMEKSADTQIPLELLPEGFYEVFIVEDLIRKRVESPNVIDDVFYPVRRDGQLKQVRILADATLVKDQSDQPILNRNDLFLEVRNIPESKDTEAIVDIYIDPAHSTHVGNGRERGRSAFNLIEANETLRMALKLKEELEALGLRVALSREDTEEVIDLYGIEGRLYKAYQGQAKYYIELNMNYSNDPEVRGSRILYSSYATNKLATAIFKGYLKTEGLAVYGKAYGGNIAGVQAVSRYEGLDSNPTIREAGGRILSAGTISDLAKEQNASFVLNQRKGIQAVSLEMIFLSNETDVTLFEENLEPIAANIASGLAKYLDLVTP